REQPGPGRDDQRPARSGQRLAERLDGEPVGRARGREVGALGEVVEGEVDDAVRGVRPAAQAGGVRQGPAVHSGPGRGQRRGGRRGPGQPGDLVSRVEQLADDGRPDEPGPAGNESAHDAFLRYKQPASTVPHARTKGPSPVLYCVIRFRHHHSSKSKSLVRTAGWHDTLLVCHTSPRPTSTCGWCGTSPWSPSTGTSAAPPPRAPGR